MGNIISKVNDNLKKIPKYTRYELRNMFLEKLEYLGEKTIVEKYNISEDIINNIKSKEILIGVPEYKTISKVLERPIEELLSFQDDRELDISFRSKCIDEEVLETVDLANELFSEILMQRKINN